MYLDLPADTPKSSGVLAAMVLWVGETLKINRHRFVGAGPYSNGLLRCFPPREAVMRKFRHSIGLAAMLTISVSPASAQQGPFRFQEATITGIHAALAAGQLTCTQLTGLYLDRIAA